MFRLTFLSQFLSHPIAIGAATPSGRPLSEAACRVAHVSDARVVVEFGPGTGTVTEVILETLAPHAKFIGIEINHTFVRLLRTRFPHTTIVEGSAADLPKLLTEIGETSCDAIVCGLPLAGFGDELQESILDGVQAALVPGGIFASYTYFWSPHLPRGKRFKKRLLRRFPGLQRSPMVWPNIPPAYLYIAQNPKT